MSDESESTGPTGKIEFIENHRPALPSGEYEITVKQSIKATTGTGNTPDEEKVLFAETFESQTRKFSVQGPRFTLEPQVIREVFPPAGSLGEHSSVLPHISFNRSTLPWERFAMPLNQKEQTALVEATEKRALMGHEADRDDTEKDPLDTPALKTPWLALLVFDQYELAPGDDLQKILGIGPELEKELNRQGIFTYQQLVKLPPAEVKRLETDVIKFRGRIGKWIEQAGTLSNHADGEKKGVKPQVSGLKACLLKKDESEKFWELEPGDKTGTPDGLLSPVFKHESGQQVGDPVTVIDVAGDLLEDILPSMADVELLGHVRKPTDDLGTPIGDEVATILANRLPQPGHMSVVHLVSLEGKYGPEKPEMNDIWHVKKDATTIVRLVSLKSWRFTCVDEKHSFKGLLHHLNKEHLFSIDKELVESLPTSMDEELLDGELRGAFVEHMSLAKGARISKLPASWVITDDKLEVRYDIRNESAGLRVYKGLDRIVVAIDDLAEQLPSSKDSVQVPSAIRSAINKAQTPPDDSKNLSDAAMIQMADAWQITKGGGKQYMIWKQGSDYKVLQNEKALFPLAQKLGNTLPDESENETSVSVSVQEELDRHLSVTATLERDTWIIEDKDKHQRFLIRRENSKGDVGEFLGVYRNQKFLFEVDMKQRGKLPGSVTGQTGEAQGIKQEIRKEFTDHSIELSLKAKIRKESVEAWRVTDPDPHGTDYMIRKNGSNYEVHRSLPHTLRLPTNHLKQAKKFVEQGCVPMPHEMRQGNRSVSWYRGPLAPGRVDKADESAALAKADSKNGDKQNRSEGSLRARSADQLVRYNPANGMFDVSYAAAWELGRLLTLQNEKVAVSLLDWKRRHRRAGERQKAMRELEHLPVIGRAVADNLPADVTRWFEDLALLRGVPFNYLVPDERMLPQESIRFFWVDPDWIRCLHDGAFTIGRVLPSDHKRDADNYDLRAKPHAMMTGFLLRSEVVSGWPDLQIDGYDEAVPHENYEHETQAPKDPIKERIPFDRWLQEAMNNGDAGALVSEFGFVEVSTIAVSPIVANSRWLVNINENETLYLIEKTNDDFRLSIENKLPLLRMERLSPNVLLCMFAGDIKTVDIHQKPEALHFGLNRAGEGYSMRYYRELKSHRGGELPGLEVDIPWKGEAESQGGKNAGKEKRVNSIKSFHDNIQTKLGQFPDPALRKVAEDSVGKQGVAEFEEKFREAAKSGTSAQFALQVTEGVQKVRFVVQKKADRRIWGQSLNSELS